MKKNNLNNLKKIATIEFIKISDWTMKRVFQKKKKKKGHNKNFKFRWKQPIWFWYDKTIIDWFCKTKFWYKLEDILFLQNVSLDDQIGIGHLYVVDIEFDYTKATEKQLVYNEIYPSIIEK